MKRESGILVFLVSAGMELCYLYAGVTFATTAIFHQPFPFLEAVGSFLIAAVLMLVANGRGWRVIYSVLLESLGFVPLFLRMVNVFHSWSSSFLNHTWLTDYFTNPNDAVEYFVMTLVIVWALVFWMSGVEFARRENDYATLGARFDRGLIVFFVLFLTKFYMQVALGIQVDESTAGFFIIPFLLASLLAIGLARNASAAQRDFMPGYQTLGVLLGFIVVILLAGTGLVFFFLPYLTLAAQKGNDVLTVVSAPLISMFFAISTFLFGADFGANSAPAESTSLPGSTAPLSIPSWLNFLGTLLVWGVGILVALVFIAIVGGLLFSIFQWLFSKTPVDPNRPASRNLFAGFVEAMRALFRLFFRKIKDQREAVRLYVALRTWGSRSGSPHSFDETPSEYGLRLAQRFPMFANEIGLIVDAFNRVVYGELVLSESQMVAARSGWRGMASPAHWLMRIKAWFNRSSDRRP